MTGFATIADIHRKRYPLMQPQDYAKLAFQSAMGPEHMVTDEPAAAAYILREWQPAELPAAPCNPEPIGLPFCRFHLTAGGGSPEAAAVLARLFVRSAKDHKGSREHLRELLQMLEGLPVQGMQTWIAEYRNRGCPPVHHSEVFRNAYHPHYRILLAPLAEYFPALLAIRRAVSSDQPVTVSLRGYAELDAAAFFTLLQEILPPIKIPAYTANQCAQTVRISPDAPTAEAARRIPDPPLQSQCYPTSEGRSITVDIPE